MKRKKIGHSAIATLGDLYQILRKAWCKETAYPFGQAEWGGNTDPSYRQCATTTMLVYDMFWDRSTAFMWMAEGHIPSTRSTDTILTLPSSHLTSTIFL